jgi:hypothetical protein
MKIIVNGTPKSRCITMSGASVFVALVIGAGCSKSPETLSSAPQKLPFESDIQAIQNNPNMPAEAKQRAIEGMKAQQSRTVSK